MPVYSSIRISESTICNRVEQVGQCRNVKLCRPRTAGGAKWYKYVEMNDSRRIQSNWDTKESDLATADGQKNIGGNKNPAGGAKKYEEQNKKDLGIKCSLQEPPRARWIRGGAKWA